MAGEYYGWREGKTTVTTQVIATLRRVPLFEQLEDSELARLSGQTIERHYNRNAIIFSEGDHGDGLYVVMTGRVAICRQSTEGQQLILAVSEPSEYFGELALFDGEPRSATAIAMEPCALLFLDRPAFRAFLQAHPSAMLSCLDVVVRHLRRCTDLVDEIALLDIPNRLARRLLLLSQGATLGKENEIPSVRITQEQLASMIGATRESINKHLNSFADAGMIRVDRGKIDILDPALLQAWSDRSD